jgi:hypothetical protein
MQEAFGIVLFVVVIIGAVGAILSLVLTGRSYRQVGRGPLSMERPPAPPAEDLDDPGLRDEIRDLVKAGNARRTARGLEPLDVEAEVERRLRELST